MARKCSFLTISTAKTAKIDKLTWFLEHSSGFQCFPPATLCFWHYMGYQWWVWDIYALLSKQKKILNCRVWCRPPMMTQVPHFGIFLTYVFIICFQEILVHISITFFSNLWTNDLKITVLAHCAVMSTCISYTFKQNIANFYFSQTPMGILTHVQALLPPLGQAIRTFTLTHLCSMFM